MLKYAVCYFINFQFISSKSHRNKKNIQTVLAYKKIWKYKDINGKLHKRLWNTATQQWESEWIPV